MVFALPPAQFDDAFHAQVAQPGCDAGGNEPENLPAKAGLQLFDGSPVQVVVVVMGHQHRIDGWQLVDGDRRGDCPFRPGKRQWRAAFRENRIGDQVPAPVLEQESGMANPGELGMWPRVGQSSGIRLLEREGLAAGKAAPGIPLPAQEGTQAMAGGGEAIAIHPGSGGFLCRQGCQPFPIDHAPSRSPATAPSMASRSGITARSPPT